MTLKIDKFKSKKAEYINKLDEITTQCLEFQNNINDIGASALEAQSKKISEEILLYSFHLENMLDEMISYMEENIK